MIGHCCNETRQQENVKVIKTNVQKKVWQVKEAARQKQEKMKEKENPTNAENQLVAENNEGWKAVKGKSAAKPIHVPDEGRMSITNGFNVLNKQNEFDQHHDQGRIVERGQSSWGKNTGVVQNLFQQK